MTNDEIKAQAESKAASEQDALVMALRSMTAFGRLNHAEIREVLAKAAELGFAFAKTGAA